MAGVKGRSGGPRPNSGGARPNSGPKPKGAAALARELKAVNAEIAKRAEKAAAPIAAQAKEEVKTRIADVLEQARVMEELFPKGSRDPLEFLLDAMQMTVLSPELRIKAAMKAVDFKHRKPGEAGKKEQDQEEAEKLAQSTRFGAGAPPKLVSNNR